MSDIGRKATFERRKDDWLVGAKSAAKDSDYVGPMAAVSFDKTWLHITTDEYEGAAMLNIEALPALQRALREIAKKIKASAP